MQATELLSPPSPATSYAAALPLQDKLRLLLADDHHLVREGLRLSLQQLAGTVEIVEADTLDRAIAAFQEGPAFDLVLLDLNMPGATGLMALDAFDAQCPGARIVIISASYDVETVQAAVKRGVQGYVPKLSGKATLLSALRFVLSGGIYVPPEVFTLSLAPQLAPPTAVMVFRPPSADTPRDAGLTIRQEEVLRELIQGKSNKQICREIRLSMGTVKGHVAAILQTMGTRTRAEAVAQSHRRGWTALLKTA